MNALLGSVTLAVTLVSLHVSTLAATVIADFEQSAEQAGYELETRDAAAEVVEADGDHVLLVTLGHDFAWPNVRLKGRWDLSAHTHVLIDITNVSSESIKLASRVDSRGAHVGKVGGKLSLDPGQTGTMRVELARPAPAGYAFLDELEGMDVLPLGRKDDGAVDPSHIWSIQVFGLKPSRPQTFRLDDVRAAGDYAPPRDLPSKDEFFPILDAFGQYRHAEWPGKIRTADEMAASLDAEQRDLQANPPPASWSELGGWKDGPTLEATGQWRTEKRDGKWWIVTPRGRLFWSLGVDVVQPGGSTIIAPGREGWFDETPFGDPRFASLVETRRNARGKRAGEEITTFEYYSANLIRKFGDGWENAFAELAHRRLPSWGFNTIGVWAKGPVIENPPMPYTHWVYYMSQRIKVWGPPLPKWFPDVYHEKFQEMLHGYAGRFLRGHADDPMLIGVFIDNELPWGHETRLGELAILAPPDTPHARAFVHYLQRRHGDNIADLNAAWGTDYASWQAFGVSEDVPTGDAVTADLLGFSEQTMRIYFEACRDIVRRYAPGKLYLGCRFQEIEVNPLVTKIAAEYCDVVSFNVYRDAVADWRPPADIDVPILIGEWHFGAPDRGVFGSGLVGVENQAERAEAIKRYVRGAAGNPLLVGAHWFQYLDQPTTGRPLDQENHQIGLVSITDKPHEQTIDAFREMGAQMYEIRGKGHH